MKIGIVIGTVVATKKDDTLSGCKLMVTQPVDVELKPRGDCMIAVDTVGAGTGETVVYVTGAASRIASGRKDSAIDAAIVGIVDNIDISYQKG